MQKMQCLALQISNEPLLLMELWRTFPVLLFFPCIYGLVPRSNSLAGSLLNNPLCGIGCNCPEKDQSFSIIDCSTRDITEIPTSLRFDHSIVNINFEGNLIAHIPIETFLVADAVEELDLSSNRLETIDSFTFRPFTSLASLRISHNKLKTIGPKVLEGLSNLRVLEIGHNALQRIDKDDFEGVPSLLELRLQYNPFFDLSEDVLEYIPKLQRLDLQDTGLVLLPTKIFLPTQNLQWLSLSNNGFENVPEEALAQASVLESLDLSGNDFTSFVQGDFIDLSNISLLYLNNLPRLTRIEKNAFVGLERLNTFSCSYNPKLEYVDEEAFGCKNETIFRTTPHDQLYLRQNALSTLKPPLAMASWSKLSFVDLADNPWKCDCDIEWMKQLKTETQMNIICDAPDRLKGRPFFTLDLTDLKCVDRVSFFIFIATVNLLVLVSLVVLVCSAIVCSRTPPALFVRVKKQFSYGKVDTKPEMVDLEWDPSADV